MKLTSCEIIFIVSRILELEPYPTQTKLSTNGISENELSYMCLEWKSSNYHLSVEVYKTSITHYLYKDGDKIVSGIVEYNDITSSEEKYNWIDIIEYYKKEIYPIVIQNFRN